MRRRNSEDINAVGFALLSMYSAFISWRLFFFAYSNNYRGQLSSISYNLVPFKTISNYLLNSSRISFDVWIYNLAGNIVAFMPLGFLLPWAFRRFKVGTTAAVSFGLILTAEVLQLVSRRGVFDVDDLILNTLGSIMGYGVYRSLSILFKGRRKA